MFVAKRSWPMRRNGRCLGAGQEGGFRPRRTDRYLVTASGRSARAEAIDTRRIGVGDSMGRPSGSSRNVDAVAHGAWRNSSGIRTLESRYVR